MSLHDDRSGPGKGYESESAFDKAFRKVWGSSHVHPRATVKSVL